MKEDSVKDELDDWLEVVEDGKSCGFLVLGCLGHEYLERGAGKSKEEADEPIQRGEIIDKGETIEDADYGQVYHCHGKDYIGT